MPLTMAEPGDEPGYGAAEHQGYASGGGGAGMSETSGLVTAARALGFRTCPP